MNKTWLVIRYEFVRHVTKRSFLFMVVGLPLLLILIWVGIFLFFFGRSSDPVGVVDLANILVDPNILTTTLPDENFVPFQRFATETAAAAALTDGSIQAYFVVSADYLETAAITLYEKGNAFEGIEGDVYTYMRVSLLQQADASKTAVFADYIDPTFVSLAEETGRDNPLIAFILPFIVNLVFIIAVFSSSGWLIQAVIDEKENRTMEILITSLRPEQLMTGKIIGLVGVGLTQITVWLLFVTIGILIARANMPTFPEITLPMRTVLVIVAWFLPLYVMLATLMAGIGISITAVAEGQQIVAILSMMTSFPLYFMFLVISNPNSALAQTLTYIPFSSPVTVLTRISVIDIPIGELAISWLILLGTTVTAVFLVGRLLHVGMLRYGQRLTWREMLGALRLHKS